MSEAARETYCDWTVTGMDCGSCATKIRDAVARLPGVSGVEVGIMTERLRLTLDETQTKRDKIEKTVRALGYEIAPRAAGAKKDFVWFCRKASWPSRFPCRSPIYFSFQKLRR